MSDLMVTIAELSDPVEGTSPALKKLRADGGLRKFNLGSEILEFARGHITQAELISGKLACNLDVQAHVVKGVIGVFVQGAANVRFMDVDVLDTENLGKAEHVAVCNANDPGFNGYLGGGAQGMLVNAS